MYFKNLIPTYTKQPKQQYNYRFTVFTPVFNCEKSIKKVHDSLINQTFEDFEWLIINDGSTDKSHEVISEIIKDSSLNIRYVNNIENRHKMSCFFQSINLAEGEFLLTFDGDDQCVPRALEVYNRTYEETPDNLKPRVGAVTALCKDQYGNLVGELFPEDPFYCDTVDAWMSKKIVGEKWGFTRTDILKGIRVNPEMLNIKFVPEGIVWNLVAKSGYLTKCINEVLRIYNIGVEGSISNTPMSPKHATGIILNCIAECNWFFKKYALKHPILFLKRIYIILRTSKHLKHPLRTYLKSIDSTVLKTILTVCWPIRSLLR
ncbi:glycosyltransferase family 2 protein [Winogradskyella sp.]|uniref:glycosyltransferase family 2 protein n=1 Tax=Winogradskyella sp. TaxID=1883156 RepID=UPI002610BCE6|nr:glycosyltransferase family 2 protein [Winogradskyella sp.]